MGFSRLLFLLSKSGNNAISPFRAFHPTAATNPSKASIQRVSAAVLKKAAIARFPSGFPRLPRLPRLFSASLDAATSAETALWPPKRRERNE